MGKKHLKIGKEDNFICFSPVLELASNHKKADTQMMLDMNHIIDQFDT